MLCGCNIVYHEAAAGVLHPGATVPFDFRVPERRYAGLRRGEPRFSKGTWATVFNLLQSSDPAQRLAVFQLKAPGIIQLTETGGPPLYILGIYWQNMLVV